MQGWGRGFWLKSLLGWMMKGGIRSLSFCYIQPSHLSYCVCTYHGLESQAATTLTASKKLSIVFLSFPLVLLITTVTWVPVWMLRIGLGTALVSSQPVWCGWVCCTPSSPTWLDNPMLSQLSLLSQLPVTNKKNFYEYSSKNSMIFFRWNFEVVIRNMDLFLASPVNVLPYKTKKSCK